MKPCKTVVTLLMPCILLAAVISAGATDLGDIQVHGFVSQGFMKSTDNNYMIPTKNGSFEFNEIAVNFSTEPSENLRFGLQLFSRDLGTSGNNNVVLDWAYGDYKWKDELGVRVGKVKIPRGFFNQGRDIDLLRTSILMPQSIYSETTRDFTSSMLGGGIYGNLATQGAGDFEYEFLFGSLNVDPNSPWVQAQLAGYSNVGIEVKSVTVAALRWNAPIPGLRLGATHQTSNVDITGMAGPYPLFIGYKNKHDYVLSAELSVANLVLVGEYNGTEAETDMSKMMMGTSSIKSDGYYGQASYRFNSLFEMGAYYSVMHPDSDDQNGLKLAAETGEPEFMAWQKDIAISGRFDITDSWLFKLEVHRINGVSALFDADNPEGYEKDWTLFDVKSTFSF